MVLPLLKTALASLTDGSFRNKNEKFPKPLFLAVALSLKRLIQLWQVLQAGEKKPRKQKGKKSFQKFDCLSSVVFVSVDDVVISYVTETCLCASSQLLVFSVTCG